MSPGSTPRFFVSLGESPQTTAANPLAAARSLTAVLLLVVGWNCSEHQDTHSPRVFSFTQGPELGETDDSAGLLPAI